jgi:hypothetical protein
MTDRYSGDPRLVLTPNGATLDYQGGQPVMDQGFENCALLSLLIKEGWVGNIFLEPEERVGSDCLDTWQKPITLSGLADDENAAVRALSTSKCFGSVTAEASNPVTDHLDVSIKIGSGGALSLTREKSLWAAQATNPANGRLTRAYRS